MPLAIGHFGTAFDRPDPANIKRQPSIPNKEGLSIGQPILLVPGLAENSTIPTRLDTGRNGKVPRHVEALFVLQKRGTVKRDTA